MESRQGRRIHHHFILLSRFSDVGGLRGSERNADTSLGNWSRVGFFLGCRIPRALEITALGFALSKFTALSCRCASVARPLSKAFLGTFQARWVG